MSLSNYESCLLMPQIRTVAKGALLCAALLSAPLAKAHEFWIEPLSYSVAVGDRIEGVLRNGEFFKGSTYPYLLRHFTRFELYNRSGGAPVPGRNGDSPALQVKAEIGGLHIAAYASTVQTVTYTDFERFTGFVNSKGLGHIVDQHREEGLSEEKVIETYYRYSKALFKVGSGAGRDVKVGMPIELVAELNPYTSAGADGVRFRLYWLGKPLPNWDVQVFKKTAPADEGTLTHYTTDSTGRVFVPADGGGDFLVNAVQITKPREADAARNAQWESIWAATTYRIGD